MHLIKHTTALLYAISLSIAASTASAQQAGSSLPNVVFIFADDLGVGDVAFYHEYYINQGLVSQGHTNYQNNTIPETVIPTPNLDSICGGGMIFTDAQLPASLCAPNRFCVQTGNNTIRSRDFGSWTATGTSAFVYGNTQTDRVSNPHRTAGDVMQAAGYRTGYIGKMHLGSDYKDSNGDIIRPGNDLHLIDYSRKFDNGLTDHGYDYTFVSPDGIQGKLYMYFEDDIHTPIDSFDQNVENWWPGSMTSASLGTTSTLRYFEETRFTSPGLVGPIEGAYTANSVYDDKGKLVTTAGNSDMVNTYGQLYVNGYGDSRFDTSEHGPILAYHAVKFIEDHVAANPTQPFMLYYASPAIHVPLTPSLPARGTTGLGIRSDFVVDLDLQVGKILQALIELGIDDNTLVILSSDNGGTEMGIARTETSDRQNPSGPFKGAKSSIWEGGHRVPFAWKWGDGSANGSVIKPGSVCDHLVSVIDWVSAMVDLTGQSVSADQHQDSVSMLPYIFSEDPSNEPAIRTKHFHLTNRLIDGGPNASGHHQSVRMDDADGQWVYMRAYTNTSSVVQDLQLWDLSTDLGQQTNLVAGETVISAVTNSLHKAKLEEMEAWWQAHDETYEARTELALDFAPGATHIETTYETSTKFISTNLLDGANGSVISFGVDSLNTVTSNWHNLSASANNLTDDSSSVTTVDISISGTAASYDATYDGTPLHTGLSSNSSVTFNQLSTTFAEGYQAIIYLTGATANTGATISDGTTTYHFQTADPASAVSSSTMTAASNTTGASTNTEAVATWSVFDADESAHTESADTLLSDWSASMTTSGLGSNTGTNSSFGTQSNEGSGIIDTIAGATGPTLASDTTYSGLLTNINVNTMTLSFTNNSGQAIDLVGFHFDWKKAANAGGTSDTTNWGDVMLHAVSGLTGATNGATLDSVAVGTSNYTQKDTDFDLSAYSIAAGTTATLTLSTVWDGATASADPAWHKVVHYDNIALTAAIPAPLPTAHYAYFGTTGAPLSSDSTTFTLQNTSGGNSAIGGVQLIGVITTATDTTVENKTTLIVPTQTATILPNSSTDTIKFGNLDTNHDYTIQATTDLSLPWAPVGSINISSGSMSVADFIETGVPEKFFRLTYEPKTAKTTLPLNP